MQAGGRGKRSQLVIYDGLEHSLVDSDARADMLQKSADSLLAAGNDGQRGRPFPL
ncbi:hypothetical protein sphantq_00253 [Sphingobium sp. AntQ-1]|uniref:hypothetical protein n=1 Tax=Sphingobium sp. AntQ-1 TaxID=2930091 RepID=UPI00279F0549|nr:hypothetical protein sphantq_00253 [Sphingobium sp. AntQ-1]